MDVKISDERWSSSLSSSVHRSRSVSHRQSKSASNITARYPSINSNFYSHPSDAFTLDPDTGVCVHSSRYGIDDLWALREEAEERSLILQANTKLDDTFFANSIFTSSALSPCYEEPESSPSTARTSFSSSSRRSIESEPRQQHTQPQPQPPHAAARHSHSRSLIEPPTFLLHAHDEMTTFAQRPDSPPELTSSKSSKSSSFHSSSYSGLDGAVFSDYAHFEDIGLDDDRSHSVRNSGGRVVGKKTSVRNLAGPLGTHSSPTPMRVLANGANKSPMAPSKLDLRSSPSMSSLGLPSAARRATSPARTISQAIRDRSRSRSRSRSPSPTHMMQGPVTPSSMPARSPAMRSNSSFDEIARRVSGQGLPPKPRKTAKEIEAEYDDTDEDLPDDASLWNVPMSPNMFRTVSSAANSARPSARTSPERESHGGTPKASLASPVTEPRTAPIPTGGDFAAVGSRSTPTSPGFSRLTRGITTGTMPDTYAFGKGRQNSWNAALSDLSDEAKALSEALDAHAAEKEKRNEVATTRQSADVEAPPKPLRSKSSLVELPPLRTNNVMIDPLPISKEKEKVMSRTRPSWLPPKDPKEEKKHLKEYQRMMEQSLEAEKRRAEKEVSDKCIRDDTTATLQRLWNDHVIPHWDDSIREPRTRELWWRGIPAAIRPDIWKRAVTNQLEVSATTYEKALARAQAVEASRSLPSVHSTDIPEEIAWLNAIRRDINACFPALNLFQSGQALHEPLRNLLYAFAFYRSDIGYVYGSHHPAALLLLTLPSAADAFIALANLLNRPLPQAFLTGDPSGTQRAYELVSRLLAQKRPKLHHHFFATPAEGGLGLSHEQVLEPLLRTMLLEGCCDPLPASEASTHSRRSRSRSPSVTSTNGNGNGFAGEASVPSAAQNLPARGISLPLALRLWDIILFDGDGAIIRAVVGLIAARESALYGSREEVLAVLGWGGDLGLADEEGDEGVERVMAVVRDVGKEDRKERKERGEKKGKVEKMEREGRRKTRKSEGEVEEEKGMASEENKQEEK